MTRSNTIVASLARAGMPAADAAARAVRLLALEARVAPAAGRVVLAFVPGRIEFLGKHTDYAGGRSLLCTVNRGFGVAAAARADGVVRVTDASSGEAVEFPLAAGGARPAGDEAGHQAGHWSNYPMTVARRVALNFPGGLVGADVAFESDLPPASGLSSSSAFVVAMFLALSGVNRLRDREAYRANVRSLEDLAGYLGAVENGLAFGGLAGDRGVGTAGGSQDHTAILCGRPGMLRQYAFRPVRHERDVPLPAGQAFVVGVSGVTAEKAGPARAAYNRAAGLARAVEAAWATAVRDGRAPSGKVPRGARQGPGAESGAGTGPAPRANVDASSLGAICAAGHADRLRDLLRADGGRAGDAFAPRELLNRLDQFYVESEQLVPAAADALAAGQLDLMGRMVDTSQANARELLGNGVPETDFLARSARQLGATAASAFGAGFGGSVWAMVNREQAEPFAARWAAAYAEAFPARTFQSFVTGAGCAAVVV